MMAGFVCMNSVRCLSWLHLSGTRCLVNLYQAIWTDTHPVLIKFPILTFVLFFSASFASQALERGTPGPLGYSDIRSGQLPPKGLYGAIAITTVSNSNFKNGNGDSIPVLEAFESTTDSVTLALLYVPERKLFNGSIGATTLLFAGEICGRLFATTDKRCVSGYRDPYVELSWSRFFGKIRLSKYPGATPIREGLSVRFGSGLVVPIGTYSEDEVESHGITLGHNTWDIAPFAAMSISTPPWLGEGTEISLKLHYNEYLENTATQYSTGDLINLDFAVTEKIGRLQIGLLGFYYKQINDDQQFGESILPDGRRAESLNLGIVASYGLPKFKSSLRFRTTTSVRNRNVPEATAYSLALIRKFR